MDIEFCFGYPFSEKVRKKMKLEESETLNGFYIYNYDIAYINCGSTEFTKKSRFNKIQRIVTETAIHETLHKVIHDITNAESNDTEEKFIIDIVKW